MFNTKYGPMSIIYSFIPIFDLYKNNFNIVSHNIFNIISNQIHIRKKILRKSYPIRYIKDLYKNSKTSISHIIEDPNFYNKYNCEIIKYLVKTNKIKSNINNNSIIRIMCENGHTEFVKILLKDKNVDPSVEDNYAIIWAIKNQHIDIVKLLLDDHRFFTDQNKLGMSVFMYSVQTKNVNMFMLLYNSNKVSFRSYAYGTWSSYDIFKYAVTQNIGKIVKIILNDSRFKLYNHFHCYRIFNGSLLQHALICGYNNIVKILLSDYYSPKSLEYMFKYCINDGTDNLLEIFDFILEKNMDNHFNAKQYIEKIVENKQYLIRLLNYVKYTKKDLIYLRCIALNAYSTGKIEIYYILRDYISNEILNTNQKKLSIRSLAPSIAGTNLVWITRVLDACIEVRD